MEVREALTESPPKERREAILVTTGQTLKPNVITEKKQGHGNMNLLQDPLAPLYFISFLFAPSLIRNAVCLWRIRGNIFRFCLFL